MLWRSNCCVVERDLGKVVLEMVNQGYSDPSTFFVLLCQYCSSIPARLVSNLNMYVEEIR